MRLTRLAAGTATLALVPVMAIAQVTDRVSVATGGAEGNSNSDSTSLSADGRYAAFSSSATNLVVGDTNGHSDIFVRDRWTGTTERVSVATGGAEANGSTSLPVISADGRFVAFLGGASNLVAGDLNSAVDVFVRDRLSGTTERVNVSSGGVEAVPFSTNLPSISADGRFVTFATSCANLVPGDTNGVTDIFVRDRLNSTTERVSVASGGTEGDAACNYSSISADGRFVAFQSASTNLVAGDGNGAFDIFVRDRQSSMTERVSVSTGGTETSLPSEFPSISIDGRYVTFHSLASDLVAGDLNGVRDIFVRDRQSATTEIASLSTGGAQANAHCWFASISATGRYVAFYSDAFNLVTSDTNGFFDVFLRDRYAGVTLRVSVATDGTEANSDTNSPPTVSADGRCVGFSGIPSNLVPGDTNGVGDAFVRDLGAGGTGLESGGIGGVPGNGDSFRPGISGDALFVAFESNATNLVAVDTNAVKDVFLHDRILDTTSLVSVDGGGNQGDGDSADPSTSSDGRYVAFDSLATNLVAGDTNSASDVFLRDTLLGTTIRVSLDSSGTQADGASSHPSISPYGRYVAFDSAASNLVGGDSNSASDVFVRD